MLLRRARALTLASALAAACSPPSPDAPKGARAEMETSALGIDVDAVASLLLRRLAPEPGERILLVAAPGRFDGLVARLREALRGAGAVDLGAWSVSGAQPAAWRTDFTDGLTGLEGEELAAALSGVDAGVMLPGASTRHAVYAALQEVLRTGRGRTVHFHWAGAYRPDGTERPPDPAVDSVYEEALLHTDYDALARAQGAFEEAMRSGAVRVTTPAGTDLTFRIGDRPVTRQDGDASAARAAQARNLIDREVELPAGAVRVAPLEETVRGRIVFPAGVWGGERVEGLTLEIDAGRVVDVRADAGVEAVRAELDAAGPAGRAFREFALGFNPLLAVRGGEDPWIPYYGYGAGVVRLSLGDNSELGGAVGGGWVRWNFVTDAAVTVGGEPWVENGRLVR